MTIRLWNDLNGDVQAILKRAADPVAAQPANTGRLYVKDDGNNVAQLWYMDDASVAHQITPAAAPAATGWTLNGTDVNLTTSTNTVGIGGSTPATYKLYVKTDVTNTEGFRAEVAATTNVSMDSLVTGDSFPRIVMTPEGIKMGLGAAAADQKNGIYNAATNVGLFFSSFDKKLTLRTYTTGVGPRLDIIGADGVADSGSAQGSPIRVMCGNSITGSANSGATGVDLVLWAGNASGDQNNDGGRVVIKSGNKVGTGLNGIIEVGAKAGGNESVDIVPTGDGVTNIGTDALRFARIRAVELVSGDMCFDDQACTICGQPFEAGDDLVLRVIRVEPDGNSGRRLTRTVPAHHGCK